MSAIAVINCIVFTAAWRDNMPHRSLPALLPTLPRFDIVGPCDMRLVNFCWAVFLSFRIIFMTCAALADVGCVVNRTFSDAAVKPWKWIFNTIWTNFLRQKNSTFCTSQQRIRYCFYSREKICIFSMTTPSALKHSQLSPNMLEKWYTEQLGFFCFRCPEMYTVELINLFKTEQLSELFWRCVNLFAL